MGKFLKLKDYEKRKNRTVRSNGDAKTNRDGFFRLCSQGFQSFSAES